LADELTCDKDDLCVLCRQWEREDVRPDTWCRFGSGTTQCLNEAACANPNHRDLEDPYTMPNDIKIDRFGRYLAINPKTDQVEPFTRATTIAKSLDDTYYLTEWAKRMVAYGLGLRPDLVALAAAADGPDDKRTLRDVAEQALQAAASGRKANIGTALHGITHKVDRGDAHVNVPAEYRDHITRYKTIVSAFGFEWIKEFIEVTLLLPDIMVAGSADRIGNWHRSVLPIVSDLKTGGTLDFSKTAIAQQLAIYANATHRWDGTKSVPMPEMNKEEALVIHLPATTDDEPKVYLVDIAEGWQLVQQSLEVRGVRKTKGKHLFTEIKADTTVSPPNGEPAPVSPAPSAGREAELRHRVTRIVEAGHASTLKAMWADDVPTLKEGGLSDDHLDRVTRWVEQTEAEKEMSF
jgi:hypothetical protein